MPAAVTTAKNETENNVLKRTSIYITIIISPFKILNTFFLILYSMSLYTVTAKFPHKAGQGIFLPRTHSQQLHKNRGCAPNIPCSSPRYTPFFHHLQLPVFPANPVCSLIQSRNFWRSFACISSFCSFSTFLPGIQALFALK